MEGWGQTDLDDRPLVHVNGPGPRLRQIPSEAVLRGCTEAWSTKSMTRKKKKIIHHSYIRFRNKLFDSVKCEEINLISQFILKQKIG